MFYPITKKEGVGIKISTLGVNFSVSTCLSNDEGYENIFSYELAIRGSKNDLLIVLSGSGNSQNILRVLNKSEQINMKSFGLLGYDGGEAIKIVDDFIHFKSYNMQICEDLQMISMNMIVQNLLDNPGNKVNMNKILVLGRNSFSGSFFARYLLSKEHDLVLVSRFEQKNKIYLPYTWTNSKISNFSI